MTLQCYSDYSAERIRFLARLQGYLYLAMATSIKLQNNENK